MLPRWAWLAGAVNCVEVARYVVNQLGCVMSKVLHWNGKDFPDELHEVPEGRYVLLPVDSAPALTPAQVEGLERAMDSLEAGRGVSSEDAKRRLTARIK